MLNYIALGLLVFSGVTLFYLIIAIHDIPYEIAKERQHPHQDAIHVSGWVSLFTLHTIWPFLWIWATLYRPDRGWGFASDSKQKEIISSLENQIKKLKVKIKNIEAEDASKNTLLQEQINLLKNRIEKIEEENNNNNDKEVQ